jgi:NAD(P)-dependent dehydrogenase (short-subunit alcohol dehydrogenase family)
VDLQLQGKKAVVTGSSRGIGKAIARALAREGAEVALVARREGPLQETAAELAKETGSRIVPLLGDTADGASIKSFMAEAGRQLGGIDILVNNAARAGGIGGRDDIETVLDENVLANFEEKVVGYLRCAREAIPYMKQNRWGRIINISGMLSRTPLPRTLSNSIRNIGVVSLSKSMSQDLGRYGINVMAVFPGATVTERLHATWAEQAAKENTTPQALEAAAAERTLTGRLIYSEDVANVVAFLCSPLAVGMTGEVVVVNGGESADIHN